MKAKAVGKKNRGALERILLNPIPQTPTPQPYFSIPAPEPYRFPLGQTMIDGVKLFEHYEPADVNRNIQNKLPNQRIDRMIKFKQNLCMMGKGGNGLLVNDTFMNIRGATAFSYGPNFLIIAFDDLRLQVYSMQLKLIKVLKNFSAKKISFLKILSVPKNYENIIILTCEGRKVFVHRIQKSMFSTLSVKLSKQIIGSLEYPVTQITQIPSIFKFYLRKDNDYRDCSLVCISAVNIVYILKVNHFRLSMDNFITIDHVRKYNDVTVNSVSWGQAKIQAPSRFISGDKLVLTYTFGSEVYFLALREIEKYIGGEVVIKCEWVQSYPLKVNEGVVAFCQFVKKSEIFIITDNNEVIIFYTKQFDIFEKQIQTSKIQQKITQKYSNRLQARVIGIAAAKKQPEMKMESRDESSLAQHERQMINQIPIITYADTFEYEYPNREIYFLTEKKFQTYHYCDWRVIARFMQVQQKFQSAMLFLIAIHKKANKFDLGVEGSKAEISQSIHMLAIEYINKKLSMIKSIPNTSEILKNLNENDQFFKMIVMPIEFLIETQEFNFLFEIAKDKIISALTVDNSETAYEIAQHLFYQALSKFIQFGRIKYIPDEQLKITLKYFVDHENLGMIDRLAIFFDLNKIDRNILIQCLLQNNLVVSLAHVCTQGNESQFVTPFVKLWGISANYLLQKKPEYAAMFAIKALWYVQLCLQRNWALKEYSFEKYAEMIRILSQHCLTQKIITGLLKIKTQYCLQTLAFYFTIENSQIICQTNKINLKLDNVTIAKWIKHREGMGQLELLTSAIEHYLRVAIEEVRRKDLQFNKDPDALFHLFLSSIIIYKTIEFDDMKYYQILTSLINNYQIIKTFKYGLEQKILNHYYEKFENQTPQNVDKILASRYINKILILVYYESPKSKSRQPESQEPESRKLESRKPEFRELIVGKLPTLLSQATQYKLTDLQAEICFLQGNFSKCIQIYKSADGQCQNLVFEFLQNAFKKLIIEKRREDKSKLAQCITKNIQWMVELNPQNTISIIQNFIQQIQDNLIEALSGKEELQLQFLQGIINNENLVQMKQKLSEHSIARYVQLMAKNKKEELIEAFKKNPKFTSQQALRICENYKVYDCMEYLYERMGNISSSVKIAALRIDQLLHSRSTALQQDDDQNAVFIKIKQILDNVIQVCRKNHSEEIWESLLDSCIELYQKYENSGLPQDEIQFFFYINGQVMENLALHCPIEHTIDLLQNKYKDLNMGGKMSRAFANILANLSHTINIYYIATNLISASLQQELVEDFQSKLQSYSTSSVCEACRFGIIKRQKSKHFKCGHAYHAECIVDIVDKADKETAIICVSCLQRQTEQFDYYLNTLNPQHPKIKKVSELFEKFEQRKMQMSQKFKVEEYEKSSQKEQSPLVEINLKKKNKFEIFDENLNEIEVGNRRVLAGLAL